MKNKNHKTENIIILVGMSAFIMCNVIYDFYAIKGVYYIGNAFAWICAGYVIERLMRNTITHIFLAVVASQFLDELWGDPTKPSLIEYVSFISILLFFYLRKKY